jgi:glutamate-1-semialdehyde 2,1-aminomutase
MMKTNRYARSQELATRAAAYDAWISSELDNPERRNYQFINGHYPLFASRGEGAYLWDVDGNHYIDFNLGYGTVLLGHAHPAVTQAVQEEIARGHCLSPLWKPLQAELCELICRSIPNGEQAFLMRTGSDATTGAVRLARVFTRRKRILRWGYNGWHDWGTPRPGGVPPETRDLVHTFPYNDLDAVERLFAQYGKEIACVVMMPFEVDPPRPGFLEGIRDLARAHGALFVLDEMRSGFRFGLGGAQEFLGITADLVTYSKAMANGFAISCIAGRADVLWGIRQTKMTATYFSATEAMAAALSCIRTIQTERVPERVWALGERLQTGLRAAIEQEGVPATVSGYPPCPFLEFDRMDPRSNERAKEIFFAETAAAGLMLHPSHHWYMCAAHTDQNIDTAVGICRNALGEVRRLV